MNKLLLLFFFLSLALPLHADPSRTDFLFQLSSALKSHNREQIAACFNFDGADESTRVAFQRLIAELASWPSPYVSSSNRKALPTPSPQLRNGHSYSLNGDHLFQVHIYQSKPPAQGYAFPAGTLKDGSFSILLAVPQ